MDLKKIKEILKAKVVVSTYNWEKLEITAGCGSDLMSDVLAFIKPNCILLTGLTNPQVVRTAEMADIKAICFVRGKKPDSETIELVKNKNIPTLLTDLPMFESCGRLYNIGLRGISEVE